MTIKYHAELVNAEKVREVLRYDPLTGNMIWVRPPKSHPRLLGKPAGCPRISKGKAYIWIKIDGRAYSLSRVAFLWMTGRWPGEQIDHIDGNSLNNQWSNLREATRTQNAWNHKKRTRSYMLPMGVRMTAGGFQARIAKNKVLYNLGVFPTVNLAKRAYEVKRSEFFGEFA